MKVAIYCRVSTDEQDLEQQVKACQNFCHYKEFTDTVLFTEKISGAKAKRPEYDALVKALRSGEYGGVVVFRIDRLGRNSRQIMLLFDELDSKGIKVFSINENLDTTTAMGRAMRELMCVFAQLEREQISEATKHRLTALKNLGKKLGRPEVVSPELSEKIKQLKSSGMSVRAIAQAVGIKKSSVQRTLSQKGKALNPKELVSVG